MEYRSYFIGKYTYYKKGEKQGMESKAAGEGSYKSVVLENS